MTIIIYRGTRKSASAFALRDAIRATGLRAFVNKRGRAKRWPQQKIINWGTSELRRIDALNHGASVAVAIDKCDAFEEMADANVSTPDFCFTKEHASILLAEGAVVCRTVSNGHGGKGIVIARAESDLVAAPLYTQYVKKSAEYRVHVFLGKVVAVQQKRKRAGIVQTKDQALIRNAANGWVYASNNVVFASRTCEAVVRALAIKAVAALLLDIGAVDVIVSKEEDAVYVLEINTAPGLESPTVLAAYAVAIKEWSNGSHHFSS